MIDLTDNKERRAFLIYDAKVNLTEARRRRHQRVFAATLLAWAAKSRREAAAIDIRPAQRDLFGGVT